jgi:hypothetical protein
MKSLTFLYTISIIAALILSIAGCSNDDGPISTSNEFLPPTNLRALSKDASVQLIWDAPAFQSNSDFARYRIVTTGATTRTDSTTATTCIVPGLVNGTIDTFVVFTVKTNGVISKGSEKILWGSTARYMHRRIYEFDAQDSSGLDFTGGDVVRFLQSNRDSIDLWIDGQNGATLLLKSPSLDSTSTGWRTTHFALQAGSGLDQYYPIPAASAITALSLGISNTSVYYAVTQNGNYARFVIPKGIQGTAPKRYVDIDIAYNSDPNNPWAKR